MKNKSILEEAIETVDGRMEQYGSPENCFEDIAGMWSIYLGHSITERQVAVLMVLLKVCRDRFKARRDNLVDIAGYARCAELVAPEDYSYASMVKKMLKENPAFADAIHEPVNTGLTSPGLHDDGAQQVAPATDTTLLNCEAPGCWDLGTAGSPYCPKHLKDEIKEYFRDYKLEEGHEINPAIPVPCGKCNTPVPRLFLRGHLYLCSNCWVIRR